MKYLGIVLCALILLVMASRPLLAQIISGGCGSCSLANTGVTPGSYTSTNLTVNAQGQITAASNGSGSGTVNSGTAGQVTYYASTGTAVSGENNLTFAQNTPIAQASIAMNIMTNSGGL